VELREIIKMLPAAFLISNMMWKGTFREIEQMIRFVPFLVDLMQDGEPILIFVILEGLATALSSEAETGAPLLLTPLASCTSTLPVKRFTITTKSEPPGHGRHRRTHQTPHPLATLLSLLTSTMPRKASQTQICCYLGLPNNYPGHCSGVVRVPQVIKPFCAKILFRTRCFRLKPIHISQKRTASMFFSQNAFCGSRATISAKRGAPDRSQAFFR
jgi:hypothetical protein